MPSQQPEIQVKTGSQPTVDGFKMNGKLRGSFGDVSSLLRTVSFLEVAQEKEAVNALYIESRDINKAPYLFSILKIKNDEVELIYSVPPEIAPKKRKLDMIRYLLNVLSLIENTYKVDDKVLYQLIENSVKEITETVTLDYSKLYTSYDTLKKESEDLRRRLKRLSEENQALGTRNFDLKGKNDELILRLGKLEALSDESLKAKINEWIIEHSGEINIYEFSKVLKVPETRVEEILNRLISEGYLEATS